MTDVGVLIICKLCKQPVDPKKIEEHLLSHPPSAYFDAVTVIQKWPKKRGKK